MECTINNDKNIRVFQHNYGNKFSEAVEPFDDKIEVLHLDIPVNEYIDDGNMLENIKTIEDKEQMDENEIEFEVNKNQQPLIFEENENTDLERKMELQYGPRTNNYELLPRRLRDYSHLHATLDHFVLTQFSLKHGLKIFGNECILAFKKEFQQLHKRNVLSPIYMQINSEMKKDVRHYHT
jgi:hypothetical protein